MTSETESPSSRQFFNPESTGTSNAQSASPTQTADIFTENLASTSTEAGEIEADTEITAGPGAGTAAGMGAAQTANRNNADNLLTIGLIIIGAL